jgi:outer membrane lipopolysaccharide assembly protein LptE/RlpB
MTSPIKIGFVLALAVLASGCGYRLGSLADPSQHTVAVPIFKNTTLVPQLQAQVTDAVIKRFQSDGSLRVVNVSDADVVVEGTIVDVRREPLRFQNINQAVTREYRLTLVVSVTARDAHTAKNLFENQQFTGQTDFFVTSDLQAAEAQAVPLAAEDLARKIVARIAEGW